MLSPDRDVRHQRRRSVPVDGDRRRGVQVSAAADACLSQGSLDQNIYMG
jgi:hypothetical protein